MTIKLFTSGVDSTGKASRSVERGGGHPGEQDVQSDSPAQRPMGTVYRLGEQLAVKSPIPALTALPGLRVLWITK
jgi:hypothetical protein